MATPTTAVVSGWVSEGCYLDNVAPYQLLPTTNFTSNELIPADCGTFCAGYKYFGLEDSDSYQICYCGDTLNIAPCNYPGWPTSCGGKPAYPLECSSPCNGDPTAECGNSLVLNLYIANSASASPTDAVVQVAGGGQVAPSSPVSSTQTSTPSTNPTPTITSSSANAPYISTVFETDIHTVISCASTITNCPADSTSISMTSTPVAIVVYSTHWITISSCASVVTNCPYNSVISSLVPITTISFSSNASSITPNGSIAAPTPTPGNTTITFSSGVAEHGLVWTSIAAVGLVLLGMAWI